MGVSGHRHAPAALYSRGKDPRYPLDRRLSGPHTLSGRTGQGKNPLPLPGIEPRSSSRRSVLWDYYWQGLQNEQTGCEQCIQLRSLNISLLGFSCINLYNHSTHNRSHCQRFFDAHNQMHTLRSYSKLQVATREPVYRVGFNVTHALGCYSMPVSAQHTASVLCNRLTHK
jgi:hypothetical protein